MKLREIREDLKAIVPGGTICNETWKQWRIAVGIDRYAHNCDQDQWIALCACAALRRKRQKATPLAVKVFLRRHGNDPLKFLPGFVPMSSATLPESFSCTGKELPHVIESRTGYRPAENTVKAWVQKQLGAGRYSRSDRFVGSEVTALLRHYLQIRARQIENGRARAKSRNLFRQVQSA
jgi:hypothetical protein